MKKILHGAGKKKEVDLFLLRMFFSTPRLRSIEFVHDMKVMDE
jgi:hypothetical protein